ncbi:cyclic peptide export ABC transporter [Chroococcidiopsis sp. CCMEE 29]|uniref:cyclic peptide export ABC transporter n=1 Tax=Chroococcidiopsis sp. CCMEE 29 TaxID=155894 RepID=UPI0020215403|nr:cyclic peptide export ABC transporter [Chroococcidiopsis sp. CCMEE 29]
MNLIRLLLRTSPGYLALAVFAGVLSGASAAGLIALINTTLSQDQSSTAIVAWSFAGLCLLRLITNLTAQVLLIRLSQTAILNLRILLSCRILASPLRHLEELGAHRLLVTLTEDSQVISNTVFIISFFCINISILIGCLVYLCLLSWTVFLVGISFMLLGICTYHLPMKKAQSWLMLAREQEDKLFNHFRAITEGTKELKLHRQRRQAFLSEDLHTTALSYRHHNVVGMTIFAAAASWGQILFFIAIGLLLFTLPALQKINAAILSGYALTIIYMMTPLEYIMSMLPSLSRATVALQKIESLGLSLSDHFPETSPSTQANPEVSWKCLELMGVTHSYYQEREESSFILGPIDLQIHSKELVFIVGGNGSGKSSLAKLIAGLYIPEAGEIYLDGKLIDHQNREWYRQQFSVVFSDFYLFDRFLGMSTLDLDTQTRDYLVQLQLDHKVQVKDGVLSTTALSQGQRKRLALLTAYLEDRPFYVFDEWASDQDPLFKKIFYTQLLPDLKSRGKTVLAISHDDRYFYLADRIIQLEYGKVRSEKYVCDR